MGCIITDKIDFAPEQACVPTVRTPSSAPIPLGQIKHVNLDDDAPDGGTGELTFEVLVRDCNVNQTLQWQAFRDFAPDLANAAFAGGTLEPSGTEERPLSFTLPFAELEFTGTSTEGACHKVELLVSGGFGIGPKYRDPIVTGDLGTAVWWLGVTDMAHITADVSKCP